MKNFMHTERHRQTHALELFTFPFCTYNKYVGYDDEDGDEDDVVLCGSGAKSGL